MVWAPEHERRVCSCSLGVVAVYEEFLMAGLWFPIHPLIIDVFNRYSIVPGQLGPNSFWAMTCFIIFCNLVQVVPRLSLFRAFFKLIRLPGSKGWYYFGPRRHRKLFFLLSSIHRWKNRFFFVSSRERWGFNTKWREPDVTPNSESEVRRMD